MISTYISADIQQRINSENNNQRIQALNEIENKLQLENLETLQNVYVEIENYTEQQMSEFDQYGLLETIAEIAAGKIMGKRSSFLESAETASKLAENFFKSTLHTHFKSLLEYKNAKYTVPIWEIKNSENEFKGYLVGTIHALPKTDVLANKRIRQIVDKVDFTAVEYKATSKTIEEEMTKKRNKSFENLDITTLQDWKRNINQRLKSLSNHSILKLEDENSPIQSKYGLDNNLFALSTFLNKPIESLESYDNHMKAYDNLPIEEISKYHEFTASGRLKMEENIICDLDRWINFNEQDVENKLNTLSKNFVESIHNRDKEMVDNVMLLSKNKVGLFLVGFSHIHGVKTSLEANNYKFSRLTDVIIYSR